MNSLNSMHQATEQAAISQTEAREQGQRDKTAVAPAGQELHLTFGDKPANWQDILWREWRNTEDEEYAEQLYRMIGNSVLGLGSITTIALTSTLYGLLVGYLLGLILINWNIYLGQWTFVGAIPLTLAWLGGVIGGGAGVLASQWLTWRIWLGLLTPSVFANKLGTVSLINAGLMVGFIVGLIGLPFPVGIILGSLAGIISEEGWNIVIRDPDPNKIRPRGLIGGLAGGMGTIVGVVFGQGHWLGLGLGLGMGVWLGLTWGSGPLSLLLSWLGVLLGAALFGVDNWLASWLGLAAGFGLGLIPNMFGHGLNAEDAHHHRFWYFWWRERPSVTKVQVALQQAIARWPEIEVIWAEPLRYLEKQKEKPDPPKLLFEALDSPHWVDRFAARHALVALGGEVTESLRSIAADNSNPGQQTALQLLAQIEQETIARLAWRSRELLCPHCLARFGRRAVNLAWGVSFSYYGCRLCGQSRKFLAWLTVVAVLDTGWTDLYRQQDDLLRINWLTRRALFDFDRIEIIQASDEEVERFAVQVGNDTDPFCQPRYKQMKCMVSPECRLSENTLRILRRTFGEVINDVPHL